MTALQQHHKYRHGIMIIIRSYHINSDKDHTELPNSTEDGREKFTLLCLCIHYYS